MQDNIFRILLDLYMVSDPWVLTDKQESEMLNELNAEAQKRDYKDWVEAYHEFEP